MKSFTSARCTDHLSAAFWKKLVVVTGRFTFTRGGAAVVFEVGAVFALVVLRARAVVVSGPVIAGCSILARVGRAVIYIQLRGEKTF